MKKAIDACVVGPTKCSDTAGAGARTQSQRALVKAPYAKSYFIVLYSLSMREKHLILQLPTEQNFSSTKFSRNILHTQVIIIL